jgi:hypothetical protein
MGAKSAQSNAKMTVAAWGQHRSIRLTCQFEFHSKKVKDSSLRFKQIITEWEKDSGERKFSLTSPFDCDANLINHLVPLLVTYAN